MTEIPADALLSEDSVRAGVTALERIHGHHLGSMDAEEQAQARAHWREQVQEVLVAVHGALAAPPAEGHGRAVISFSDGVNDTIDVSATFQPQLRELGDDQVEGTPAQVLALAALQQLEESDNGGLPET
jgi:hypothetical protein